MAQVPKSENLNDPQNIPQAGVQVATNPNMFGAQVGAAVQDLGSALQGGYKELEGEVYKREELQQTTQALTAVNNTYAQDVDREQQFKNLKGQDAVDAYPDYIKDVRDSLDKTAQDLSPYAREKFMSNTAGRTFYLQRSAESYVDQQTKVWHTQETTNTIKNSITDMASDPFNEQRISDNKDIIGQAIDSQAAVNGWDDATKEQAYNAYGAKVDNALVKAQGAADPARTIQNLGDDNNYPHLDPGTRAYWQSHLDKQMQNQIISKGFAGTVSPGTRGERNNNPGNLSGDLGFEGHTGTDESGYSQFSTPESGLRALGVDLVNQDKLHGLNTIQDIVGKYAPPGENNTDSYIKFVSHQMGMKPTDKMDMNDPGTVQSLMTSIITMENGGNRYSASQIAHAANIATAHLPSTDNLLSAATGNPAAQIDIAKNSTAYTPAHADDAQIRSMTGENQERVQQAVEAKRALLAPTGDPAGYLASHNLDLQARLKDALTNDPTQMARVIKESDIIYDGIGQDPNNRPIIPKDMAQGIVSHLTSSGPVAGLKNLEKMKGALGDSAFTRVYTDLVKQGQLPLHYQAAMQMDNAMDRQVLMRAYTVDPEDAKKGGGTDLPNEKMKGLDKVKSTIDASVDNDPLLHTYTASIYRQGGTQVEAAYGGVLKRMAYQFYREGADAKTASIRAVASVVGNVDMSLGSSRIPMNVAGPVKQNALAFTNNPVGVKIPSYASSPETYMQSLKGNSTWINNPDDTGLNVLDQSGKLVRDMKDKPVTIPFAWPKHGTAAYGAEPKQMVPTPPDATLNLGGQ